MEKVDEGGNMLGYGILFIGLIAIVLAIIYLVHDKEEGRYQKVSLKLSETSKRNVDLFAENKKLHEKFKLVEEKIDEFSRKIEDSEKTIDDIQTHCAKLRKSQISLQDQISKKRPLIKMPKGPIAIEVYTPTTKGMGGKRNGK